MNITSNGRYNLYTNDVQSARVNVNVPSNVQYIRNFNLNENRIYQLTAESGYDGLRMAQCHVNVPIQDLDIYQISYVPKYSESMVTKTISELRTNTFTISDRSFVMYKQGSYIYMRFYTVASSTPTMSSGICVHVDKSTIVSLKNRLGQTLFVINPTNNDEGAPNFDVQLSDYLITCKSLI